MTTASIARPPLRRLVLVELRKSTDTRAGRWLIGLLALLSVIAVVLVLTLNNAPDQNFSDFAFTAQLPMGLLLPVLGILSMSGEWSQRTALTTFALVPDRGRVLTAKLIGLLSLSTILVAASVVAASIATLIASAEGGGHWGSFAPVIGRVLLFEALAVSTGAAFGLALLNAPAAIVGFFILPSLLTALVSLSSALRGPVRWLDFVSNTTHLLGDDLGAQTWAKIVVSVAVWAVLPFAAGSVRVRRSDIS